MTIIAWKFSRRMTVSSHTRCLFLVELLLLFDAVDGEVAVELCPSAGAVRAVQFPRCRFFVICSLHIPQISFTSSSDSCSVRPARPQDRIQPNQKDVLRSRDGIFELLHLLTCVCEVRAGCIFAVWRWIDEDSRQCLVVSTFTGSMSMSAYLVLWEAVEHAHSLRSCCVGENLSCDQRLSR